MTIKRRIMRSIHEKAMRSVAGEGSLRAPSVTPACAGVATESQA
jgi:hypothetical protein